MPTPEARLIRALFAYARSVAGITPVSVSLVLSDRRQHTIELPTLPPPEPSSIATPGARLLSPDAERVVALLAAEGDATAKHIMQRLALDKNRVYFIIDDLTARAILTQTADGYAVASPSC